MQHLNGRGRRYITFRASKSAVNLRSQFGVHARRGRFIECLALHPQRYGGETATGFC